MVRRLVPICALVLLSATAQVGAFSFLDFPGLTRIESNQLLRWPDAAGGQPFVITYAIADDFLAGEDAETLANVDAAVAAAFQSWSDATNGLLRFEPAAFNPYEMKDDEDGSPPGGYIGMPYLEWLNAFIACPDQACRDALPPPGWGAHIDIFSAPVGTSFDFDGFPYEMTECNLGFTMLRRQGTTEIRSVDIYLNEKWDWTTNEALVTPISGPSDDPGDSQLGAHSVGGHAAALGNAGDGQPHASTHGVVRYSTDPRDPTRNSCAGLELVIDLETVLVHEFGHAIGLDHPDEATANGSVSLDPFTFAPLQPPFVVPGEVVMRSNYTGVRRVLTHDDAGGLAFLYPPALTGDITSDGSIGMLDVILALEMYEGDTEPTPWAVNLLDFNNRNGRIDMSELQQLLLWFTDPVGNPPGDVPSDIFVEAPLTPGGPADITVAGFVQPGDLGFGGTASLTLTIENPDAQVVEGWELRLVFNSDVLVNPRYGAPPTFLAQQSLLPIQVTPMANEFSELRCGSFGFVDDNAAFGSIVTIDFDIDLAEAVPYDWLDFPFVDAEIVVAEPYSHSFSMDPNFPDETLNTSTVSVMVNNYDADANGAISLEDLYAYNVVPIDVNKDSAIDATDRDAITTAIRMGESADVVGAR